MSCRCPLLFSNGVLHPSCLLARMLWTLQTHFWTQSCLFSGTLNVLIALRTILPNVPMRFSARFCHGESCSVVRVLIHASLQCLVHVMPVSLCAQSNFSVLGALTLLV